MCTHRKYNRTDAQLKNIRVDIFVLQHQYTRLSNIPHMEAGMGDPTRLLYSHPWVSIYSTLGQVFFLFLADRYTRETPCCLVLTEAEEGGGG